MKRPMWCPFTGVFCQELGKCSGCSQNPDNKAKK